MNDQEQRPRRGNAKAVEADTLSPDSIAPSPPPQEPKAADLPEEATSLRPYWPPCWRSWAIFLRPSIVRPARPWTDSSTASMSWPMPSGCHAVRSRERAAGRLRWTWDDLVPKPGRWTLVAGLRRIHDRRHSFVAAIGDHRRWKCLVLPLWWLPGDSPVPTHSPAEAAP
jgi:hypothetical protein